MAGAVGVAMRIGKIGRLRIGKVSLGGEYQKSGRGAFPRLLRREYAAIMRWSSPFATGAPAAV